MVVLDFLGHGQREAPPQKPKGVDGRTGLPVYRGMILESVATSPRIHEQGFITKLQEVRDKSSVQMASGAVQAPLRFTRHNCGGSNQNGTLFSPHNIATPPQVDAAMSARESARVKAAIAQARSTRAKPMPRHRPQGERFSVALPVDARRTPRVRGAVHEVALNMTSSHVVGTVKPHGHGTALPALPKVSVEDPEEKARLKASLFDAFKKEVTEAQTERQQRVAGRRRRRAERAANSGAGGGAADQQYSTTTGRNTHWDRRDEHAATSAALAAQAARAEAAGAKAGAKVATARADAVVTKPRPPPAKARSQMYADPRFPAPAPSQRSPRGREEGVPAGISSWEMGKQHPAVPREPGDASPQPPAKAGGRSARQQPEKMMSTIDK